MSMHREAARWRLGELVGGDGGKEMVEEARRWLRNERVKKPSRLVGMLAPVAGGE